MSFNLVLYTTRCKQRFPQIRKHLPVSLQRIDICDRDAPIQVSVEIVQVFRLTRIDIARNVKVLVVLGNLLKTDHAAVTS